MGREIVIIGGGASGVLLSAHLLRRTPADLRVSIVERRPELGAGAAYATNHPDHLLNVRASNMSAFPDEPGHFASWLRRHGPGGDWSDADCFAPRHLYRDYLGALIERHRERGLLRGVAGEARAVTATPHGIEVVLDHGLRLAADCVVLATGNEGPKFPPAPWRHEGWTDSRAAVDPAAPVVVVGTGLTMVDRVMALLHAGHTGSITAISRHGLVPQGHRIGSPMALSGRDIPFGTPLPRLLSWLRRETVRAQARGQDWREVVDALRPYTQRLWQHLPAAERRRFLRHARPFWDAHRHRVAPAAAARLAAARERGQVRIVAAHVTGFQETADGVDVDIARRGTRLRDVVHAKAVFECRGRSADVTHTDNPVLRQLFASGSARPDPLRLGLDVTHGCALFDREGRASTRLYALGPVTAGIFWEIVAIPDIRRQAAMLASALIRAA